MRGLVREFTNFWSLRLLRLVVKMHQPMEVGPPVDVWCPTCRKPWPCDEIARAADEIARLKAES